MREAAASALTVRVGALPLRPLVACDAGASIADVASRMAAADTASVVIVDADGRPAGIITDSDLRRRVLALGRDTSAPASAIASAPVVTLGRDSLGLDAVQLMLERRIHHLAVVDDAGRATGVVADSDLLAHQAAQPLLLARRIERAATVEELGAAHAQYPETVALLLDAGARASEIGRILAETNDRLQRRLVALAERALGGAPAPFAWIVMGSEGRRVQTLRTDQDNGLVADDAAPAEADAYFARFASWMVDALERVGAPRCQGDVMATNPLWRGRGSDWRARFSAWLAEPKPDALLRAMIAFDFRGAAGTLALVEDLRAWLVARTPVARMLQLHVARELAHRRVALGPLGRLKSDGFDGKMEAIGIAVDGARLLALQLGIAETSTLARIARAAAEGAVPAGDATEVAEAYEAISALRLRRQVALAAEGKPPDNRIVPKELGRATRAALREHLQALARFQRGVVDRFGPGTRVE
ncbi:MAG TPA: DUF294 nucleotidyltransferase-like domain-containing protein [Candidatus Limnocylindria bacterium]|nr:DUF294 nucleotidyltransferase-like domain-containing protein [Candidatus Limnocylindria bacterium]